MLNFNCLCYQSHTWLNPVADTTETVLLSAHSFLAYCGSRPKLIPVYKKHFFEIFEESLFIFSKLYTRHFKHPI